MIVSQLNTGDKFILCPEREGWPALVGLGESEVYLALDPKTNSPSNSDILPAVLVSKGQLKGVRKTSNCIRLI